MAALLLGGASAQTAPSTPPTQDSPYSQIVREAQQVIVYAPRLFDGHLVNSLKMANNLGIPVRVITTRNGLMQQSGHVLTLVVVDIPVYEVPDSGERRTFMEVQNKNGWKVYDISQGRPVEKRMVDYMGFNDWFAKTAPRLKAYVPELALTVWVKAFLGKDLNITTTYKVEDKDPTPPAFLNTPPRK